MKQFSLKPVHPINLHPQLEEDWINSGPRISHSKMDVSRIWPKT